MPKDFAGKDGLKDYLTPADVAAWPTAETPCAGNDRFAPLRSAMVRNGLDGPTQIAGRHFPMGCVALEITQRCNLDCSACYLSDLSEAVRDLPLTEILRRIDLIAAHYGPRTNVQITGGDPTLRPCEDLIAIVRRIAEHGMRPALFTNGIKADRDLLRALAAAGLKDVAFHVDMTQDRKGYDSEAALNVVREAYIERAQGLGLQVLFNTTIFEGNIDDVAMLAAFFRDRARDIHLASFQMIADTGRGVARERAAAITQQSVMTRIAVGAGAALSFDTPRVGHPDCNRYAMILTAGEATAPVFAREDAAYFEALFLAGREMFYDRHDLAGSVRRFAVGLCRRPGLVWRSVLYAARKIRALRRGLWKARGRVDRLTFYIHNFMHADKLERDRCEACVFMTMTRDGPVSMCVHNAKRDAYILQPVRGEDGAEWKPLGDDRLVRDVIDITALPVNRLKGRARAERMKARAGRQAVRMPDVQIES